MDANQLLQCFEATLLSDKNIRTNAEEQLKAFSKNPGFLGACLDVINSNQINDNIKLSASLYFKNKIFYGWSTNDDSNSVEFELKIDNDEKPVIKELLIKTMVTTVSTSSTILNILKSALQVIITEDYSKKQWQDLLPNSLQLLSSGSLDNAYIGLLCLSEIFRTYRWTYNDDRQDLEILIDTYFNDLLNFANNSLLKNGENINNIQIGEMLKLVIKCYKFVIYYDLPFKLQTTESFIPWANFFVKIIELPLSNEILSLNDKDLITKNPWVKLKKWSYYNLFKLYQRYASNSLSQRFNYNDFKDIYSSQFLPNLLQLLFTQIDQWRNKQLWLSDASIYFIINFIEQSIIDKNIWPLVKPHYNDILSNIIFPILCPNEESLETFENDPEEYIHRNYELWDNDYSPDLATSNLLITSVTKRSKSTLQITLEFILQILQSNVPKNANDLNNISLDNAIKIESALRMFSNIIDRLLDKKSPYFDQTEEFLTSFVFPFFNSNFGFLKTRTCDICSKIGTLEFKDKTLIQVIFNGIMNCLNSNDDCLPVQLTAALALQTFIQDVQFQNLLNPHVVPTMQTLLKISNEFESDTISGVMQEFVEQFAEQLQPFSVDLMNNLVQQFLKLANDIFDASNFDPSNITSSNEIPDETNKQMAALGILSTAISILLSFENSSDIVKNLEESFYPAAEFILRNGVEDFYRECSEFFENSTFLLRTISPVAWKVLELIGECNRKDNSMVSFYLEDFMLILNNYLLYGSEELKKMNMFANIFYEVYQNASPTEETSANEMSVIFDLSQKIVFSMQDKLPEQIRAKLLQDAITAIINEKDSLKKFIIFSATTFNAIIANLVSAPLFTLQALVSSNCLELFFEYWFNFFIPNFKRVYDIKLSIMGLLSISCTLQPQDIASLSLNGVFLQIGNKIVTLFAKLPGAMQHLERQRKEFSLDDADNYINTFDDFEDLDDIENEEDNIEKIWEEFKSNNNGGIKFVNGESFNDNEDFDDLEEDPLSGSVLDTMNVYEIFKNSINGLQQADPARYQVLIQSLSKDDQDGFSQLLSL